MKARPSRLLSAVATASHDLLRGLAAAAQSEPGGGGESE